MIKNLRRVRPNLIRGGAPASINDLNFLLDKAGVDKIISLDQRSGDLINPFCQKQNVDHTIIDLNVGNAQTLKNLFSHNIHALVEPQVPTFVHCRRGMDRTGFFVALVRLLLDDWDLVSALQEAKGFGFGMGMEPAMEQLYCRILRRVAPTKDDNAIDDGNMYHDEQTSSMYPSWGLYADPTYRSYPYASETGNYTDNDMLNQAPTHNNELEHVGRTPSVGVYDQTTEFNFLGPSLVGSGFI